MVSGKMIRKFRRSFFLALIVLSACNVASPELEQARALEKEHQRHFHAWLEKYDRCVSALTDNDTIRIGDNSPSPIDLCTARFPYPPDAVAAEQNYRVARNACWRALPGDWDCPEWHNQPGYSDCYHSGNRGRDEISSCIRKGAAKTP